MHTTENTLEVANEIARQIGNKAFAMMGTKNKLGDDNSLLFDIRGCSKFNKIRVTLDAMDTYTVRFIKVGRGGIVRDESLEMVYADNLKAIIESKTGLYLSL